MAKDVDLTSHEWLDIVFDGKNKEFGAYEMRANSVKRHNKAVLIVFAALAVVIALLIMSISGVFNRADGDEAIAAATQEDVAMYDADAEEEDIEEEEQIEIPEEQPVMEKEEVANQIQNTIIDIVEDNEVVNEVKNQEDLREDNRMIGGQDISDGVDDLTKQVVTQEVIVVEEKPKEDIIYNTANVQQQPTFPGGDQAMYKWLSEHIVYPPVAAEEGVQGKVIVEFVVSKTGSIENVKVLRGPHPALNKEAERVVKSMPAWNPGRNNGQAVKVTYVLPVTFRLQK